MPANNRQGPAPPDRPAGEFDGLTHSVRAFGALAHQNRTIWAVSVSRPVNDRPLRIDLSENHNVVARPLVALCHRWVPA
jgi:hypothetical protein